VTFRIETALLDTDEADRLYRHHPELRDGPCPTCRGERSYRWQGQDHGCVCQRQRQLAKHYSAAGIGVTYQRLDWSDFEGNQELLAKILKYLDNHDRYVSRGVGLLFHGPIGVGKTMAANLMLKELIKRGYTAFATTFAGTIEMFTAGWRSIEEKQYFQEKFMYSQVLLLDDLGRELRTGHNLPQSTFDMILRTRVAEGRPTILTTNCSLAELETGYGAQVLSLLQEQSVSYQFSGTDFRPRANKRTKDELDAGEVRPIV